MLEASTHDDDAELSYSKEFHKIGMPVLVSETLLRSRNCGQVDLARILKRKNGEKILEVVEVKATTPPSKKQMKRVGYSADFLSRLIDIDVTLKFKVMEESDEFF